MIKIIVIIMAIIGLYIAIDGIHSLGCDAKKTITKIGTGFGLMAVAIVALSANI